MVARLRVRVVGGASGIFCWTLRLMTSTVFAVWDQTRIYISTVLGGWVVGSRFGAVCRGPKGWCKAGVPGL